VQNGRPGLTWIYLGCYFTYGNAIKPTCVVTGYSISLFHLIVCTFQIKRAPVPAQGRAPVPAQGRAPVPAQGRAPVPAQGRASAEAGSSTHPASISVLRYEKQLLDQQVAKYQDKLKPAELESLCTKGRTLELHVEQITDRLKRGGAAAHRGTH
jgi:hypothetical protein